ncbi:hypothetical protein NDR89_19645 [Cupriavidus gilardii]|uniref:Uncharacterized protein n=1 Tax=Cupriavidus gilardii TaxID=82541 RepID=A0ABY4VNS7_9BURK|nr:hypothetical protein [Cupriavidus gilardii]USE78853.1 hypothetical protein NDR89_19645 [Cupriavidus gilardii]
MLTEQQRAELDRMAEELAKYRAAYLPFTSAANQYAAACREQMRRLHGGRRDQ